MAPRRANPTPAGANSMRLSLHRLAVWAAVIAALHAACAAAEEKKAEEGFMPLFNGKDLTGWKTFLANKDADPAKTWSVKDGVIHCTGKPNGYFYSDKSFKNYVIRYDWRYPAEQPEKTTLNSGLLVHIQEPHKVWPKCIEAQGAYANHGKIYFVSGAKKINETEDTAARKKALKPKEEWQTTEVTCGADGTITVKINGIEVATGKSELTEGPIGFQSEGAAIEFRNIRIKPEK
jgi:hypothetical protein